MKKFLTGVLCLALCASFALTSCQKQEEAPDEPENTEDNAFADIVIPEEEEEELPTFEYDYSKDGAVLIAVNGDIEEAILPATVTRMKKQKQTKVVTEEVTAADGTVSTVEKEVEETVEVPEEYTLTEIASGVFMDNTTVKKVVIPDSVHTIGKAAFQGCTALEEVTLPAGLDKIGDHMFYGCDSLTTLAIPETVTDIGIFAFGDYFKRIPWYEALTEESVIVGDGILLKCNATAPVSYDNVKKVAYYAFLECKAPTATFTNTCEEIHELAVYRTEMVLRLPEDSKLVSALRLNNWKVETYAQAVAE